MPKKYKQKRFQKRLCSKEEYAGWLQHIQSFNKKNKPMTNIWEREELQSSKYDANSKFLNKAIGPGDTIKLKFVSVIQKDQDENTDDQYKTPDGKEWFLYFEDTEGKEREMTQRSTKGKMFSALREAEIQPEQWIWIKREGEGLETEYEIALAAEEGAAPAPKAEEPKPATGDQAPW